MRTILMVDDEPNVCWTVKRNLEATGEFEVSICSNSLEAVQKARELRPDIILLDVNMPELSGPEIVEQLEAHESTKSIPFIYLTTIVTESEVLERENTIGGNCFVAKPFKTADLIRVINLVAKT